MDDFRKIFVLAEEINRNKRTIEELRKISVSKELIDSYEHLLQEQTEELVQAKFDAENSMNEIKDDTARLIAKMRFIDMMSWTEIGRALNYDRTAVYRKLKKEINRKNREQ